MARYDYEEPQSYQPDLSVVPALVNTPVIFIAPPARTVSSGELWMAVSSSDPNYGGCIVHASNDGTTYYKIGRLYGNSVTGVLTAALPSASGTDTTNTLAIDLSQSKGIIESVDQNSVDALDSLCYVGGEFLAYRDAALTGVETYNLSYLKRALYGSAAGAASGSAFALLNDTLFKYRFNKNRVGATMYFKFQGFNSVGNGLQDIASLVAYSVVLTSDGGIKALLSDVSAANSWSGLSGKPSSLIDIAALSPLSGYAITGFGTNFSLLQLGNGAVKNVGTASTDLAAGNRGIPAGGSLGMALVKVSNADYDVHWAAVSGGGGGGANIDKLIVQTSTSTLSNLTLDLSAYKEGDVLRMALFGSIFNNTGSSKNPQYNIADMTIISGVTVSSPQTVRFLLEANLPIGSVSAPKFGFMNIKQHTPTNSQIPQANHLLVSSTNNITNSATQNLRLNITSVAGDFNQVNIEYLTLEVLIS